MWDGKKMETGLTPRYEDWCSDRDEPVQVGTGQREVGMTLIR
jgi:hypothetical protein